MATGISNARGKSGGGSVAVVEINASQIDENTGAISFTASQYNTFNTNQLVLFQIEGETTPKYLFSVSDDGNKLNCLNLEYDRGALQDQSDATLNVMFLYINKTPLNSVYTGYFINDTFSKVGGGGKQLYQHCIYCKRDNGTVAMLTIINDSDVAFTFSTLCTYLNSKGFIFGTTKYLMCNGTANDNNSFKNIIGLQVYNTDVLRFIYSDNANQVSYVSSTYLSAITDTIITL